MKLRFLGTRGYIQARTPRHCRHAALMVGYYGREVMVDCGEDWLGRWEKLKPRAIVITHPHPDHVRGVKEGASGPVYATEEATIDTLIQHAGLVQMGTVIIGSLTKHGGELIAEDATLSGMLRLHA